LGENVKIKKINYSLMLMIMISFIAQILSLFKSSIVAGSFGAGNEMDAYNLANNVVTFVFGFAQVATYTYLCCIERFYAEIAINIYYFFTMIYGVYCWRKRLSDHSLQVQTRRLSHNIFPFIGVVIVLLSVLTGWLLQRYTDDPQPYLDAFTTIPAIAAQILMVMAYREQWYLWLMVDLLALVMWLRAENYCMAAQYAFWCANCVYGYIQWTKSMK
jgi:nicotinamide mononucleotide transporter